MIQPRDFWDFSDPAGSEQTFRRLIAGDLEESDRWVVKTQVARALGLQTRFEEAMQVLDELPEVLAVSERWQAYALLEHGRVLNSSGKPDLARPLFELAAQTPHDDLRIDALHMLAIVFEPEEALALNERALEEAERSSDPYARLWMGSLLNNLGWTKHDLGHYDDALDLFQRALAFRLEQGQAEPTRIARWCVARCLRSLGRCHEALAIQRELESGPPDPYVYEEIAECLAQLGDQDEADKYRELAKG